MRERKLCCGEVHHTAYCPHCGTKMPSSYLHDVAAYCARFEQQTFRFLTRYINRCGDAPDDREKRQMDRLRRKIDKWKTWKMAVEEAAKREEEEERTMPLKENVSKIKLVECQK